MIDVQYRVLIKGGAIGIHRDVGFKSVKQAKDYAEKNVKYFPQQKIEILFEGDPVMVKNSCGDWAKA